MKSKIFLPILLLTNTAFSYFQQSTVIDADRRCASFNILNISKQDYLCENSVLEIDYVNQNFNEIVATDRIQLNPNYIKSGRQINFNELGKESTDKLSQEGNQVIINKVRFDQAQNCKVASFVDYCTWVMNASTEPSILERDMIRALMNESGTNQCNEIEKRLDSNLQLNRTHIQDIHALKFLKKVRRLDLSGNNISDLSPIQELTQLRTIILDLNPITDLSALVQLPQIQYIKADHTQVQNLNIKKFPKSLIQARVNGVTYKGASAH